MSEQFNIRALGRDDWQAFKEIRLLALKNHSGNYGATFEEESAYPDQEWIRRIENPKGCIFGLFHHHKLIGLNAVFTGNDDPSEKTAVMAMWYMRDGYKGQNLFAGLVQAGIDWLQSQERFEKIRVNHRGGNFASEANIRKAGFTHIGTEDWTWPDGQVADYCMYERILAR